MALVQHFLIECADMTDSDSFTYKDAGVDINKAAKLVNNIKTFTQATQRDGVRSQIGSFGALFEIPPHFRHPLLVSGTDGVGTKLALALALNQHDTIGIDLVAMCANDILCHGAEPLFFLDYYATGKLNEAQAIAVIKGISEGCQQAGCALVGGETAEMPGMYKGEAYDLAGFCVGAVEKSELIDGSAIAPGDQLIALASSGPHANGYSFIRHILAKTDTPIDPSLLTPTRIYVQSILTLKQQIDIHGIAHITGGGITENLPRILPPSVTPTLHYPDAQWPEVFHWIQETGQVSSAEMRKTFNCGVGMIVAVSPKDAEEALAILTDCGETAWLIGNL